MRRALIFLAAVTCAGAAAFADQSPPVAPPPATGQFLSFFNEGQVFLLNREGSGPATFGWGPTWDYAYGSRHRRHRKLRKHRPGMGVRLQLGKDKNGNSYGFSATIEFGGQFLS